MPDYMTTAPTTIPITLAEAKAHLNVSTTVDDALITAQIKAAAQYLEDKTRRCFIRQTRVTKCDGFGDTRYVHNRRLYPGRGPIVSVTSLKYVATDGTTTTISSSDYVVGTNDWPGFVAEADGASWPTPISQPNSVQLTYVAGIGTSGGATSIPENVKQAVRLVVGHWYRNREAVMTSGAVSQEVQIGVNALLGSEMTEGYA